MISAMDTLAVPGGRIAFTDEGHRGDLPPVVLLHGGVLDHRMWDAQRAHLAGRTRVVAADARGHGWSSTPRSPFRQCDDVARLVDHIGEPAVLVGLSMGGGAAVDTALEHPEAVAGLVVSGAGTNEVHFEDPFVLAVFAEWAQAAADLDPDRFVEASLAFLAGPHRDLAEVEPRLVQRCREMAHHTVTTHAVPDAVTPHHVTGSWERLGEVDVPTLAIVGRLDSPDHLAMAARLADDVPDASLVEVPGTAHYPNLERPAEWDAAVDRLLERVRA